MHKSHYINIIFHLPFHFARNLFNFFAQILKEPFVYFSPIRSSEEAARNSKNQRHESANGPFKVRHGGHVN